MVEPADSPGPVPDRVKQDALDKIVYQIEESREGSNCLAYCPELVITAFGDSPEEARNALRAEISAYLGGLRELGILDVRVD